MEIEELEKYRKKLSEEIVSLQQNKERLDIDIHESIEDKKILEDSIKKQEAYNKRLQSDHLQLLVNYKLVSRQIIEEESKLGSVQNTKKNILLDVKNSIEAEQKKINELKRSYDTFIKEVNQKANENTKNEEILQKQQKDINDELKNLKLKDSALNQIINNLADKEIKVAEKEMNLVKNKKEIEEKSKLISRNLSVTEYMKKDVEKDKLEILNRKQLLEREQSNLLLQKEAVEKERMALEEIKQGIETNRKHLESQQSTLRLAFQEAKKKGI